MAEDKDWAPSQVLVDEQPEDTVARIWAEAGGKPASKPWQPPRGHGANGNWVPGAKDRYTEQERRAALQHVVDMVLEQGYSQNKAMREVANDMGLKSHRTLGWWAQGLGIDLPSPAQARAQTQEARDNLVAILATQYDQAKRLELSNLLFATVKRVAEQQLAAPVPDSGVIKDVAVTYAVLSDKRRLEEGKPTTHEQHDYRDANAMYEAGMERLRVMRGGKADAATG